jgi:hypothetical protein
MQTVRWRALLVLCTIFVAAFLLVVAFLSGTAYWIGCVAVFAGWLIGLRVLDLRARRPSH